MILVEAKSYPEEVFSSGSQAKTVSSVERIAAALVETQKWLQVSNSVDWTGRLYQSANRLAHLHFFRSRGVPAWLVNVYFCDSPEPGRCTTRSDWERTVGDIKRELGFDPGRAVPHAGEVFLQARPRTELK